MEIPTTYLFGWIGPAKFHARIEHYEDLIEGMKKKIIIEYIDVDGGQSVVNAARIDSLYISTPESREASRAFFEQEKEEDEAEEKEEWEK